MKVIIICKSVFFTILDIHKSLPFSSKFTHYHDKFYVKESISDNENSKYLQYELHGFIFVFIQKIIAICCFHFLKMLLAVADRELKDQVNRNELQT